MCDKSKLMIFLVLLSGSLFGQDFQYKASVDAVDEDGFYNILLAPDITAHMQNGFNDIRLYNEKGGEVPYLLIEERAFSVQEFFVEYEILEIKHFKNKRYTRIVIHNPTKNEIDNIVLRVKNADVKKSLKLNGSNNNREWYVLKDQYDYNSILNYKEESEIRVLNFPASTYEFYEILIDDYYDEPIYVQQAGYFDLIKEGDQYTELKTISYSLQDTLKETIVAVALDGNYVDKISFEIQAPEYYHREAALLERITLKNKKINSSYFEKIKGFDLVSNSSNILYLKNFRNDTAFIRIKNNDDAALDMKGIHFYQLNKYLTAELLAKENYTLKFGDQYTKKPEYDLKYFRDHIPQDIKTIGTGKSVQLVQNKQQRGGGNVIIQDYWMWFAIVAVGLFLFYMSYKMVEDNKKK